MKCWTSWAVVWLSIVAAGCDRGEEKKNSAGADAAPVTAAKAPASTWGPTASAGLFTEITAAVGLEE
ncbi:MAG TPA: hypothetical protein VGP99_01845, partial [Tepidisphaeraceae bacterium]|nr:hypothetical protein [Tepidisphaeraceae bacterium]